ncbi:MAG: hypothetical protein K8R53_05000, partial [Bacteroidales bacterium]|nr:hypothetical protein [Bacteroidales bacterium]
MKRYLLATFILCCISSFAIGQRSTFTYSFEKPEIISVENGYSIITVRDCYLDGEEGYPLMPYYGADILVNQRMAIKEVKILSVEFYKEINDIKIQPASKQFPISKGPDKNYKVIPNLVVYGSDNIYPGKIVENIETGFLSGHSIGSFSICPVEYIPSENKIKTIRQIIIEVVSEPSILASTAQKHLSDNTITLSRISKVIENKEDIKHYSYEDCKDADVDLLIISKDNLLSAFDDLVNYKTSTGYIVETVSTESIFSQYSGQDNQDKIRNCIIDYHSNKGLQYVILSGDSDPNNSSQDIIPHRGFYALDDSDIPSDMYYSCLDGTWNDDGDNKWGEPGEYDLYAEVGIGRICVDNASEAGNFIN